MPDERKAHARERVCVWSENENAQWETGCDHTFECNYGTPADNKFTACPYCAGTLKAQPYQEEKDDA